MDAAQYYPSQVGSRNCQSGYYRCGVSNFFGEILRRFKSLNYYIIINVSQGNLRNAGLKFPKNVSLNNYLLKIRLHYFCKGYWLRYWSKSQSPIPGRGGWTTSWLCHPAAKKRPIAQICIFLQVMIDMGVWLIVGSSHILSSVKARPQGLPHPQVKDVFHPQLCTKSIFSFF